MRPAGKLLSIMVVALTLGLAAGAEAQQAAGDYKRADALFAKAQYREAAKLYEQVVLVRNHHRTLAAYCLFQAGLCRHKERRHSEAASLWTRLRQQYPQTVYAPRSLLWEAEVAPSPLRAQMLRDEIVAKYPTSAEAATILIARGHAAFGAKDYRKAAAQWETFLQRFAVHPQRDEIQKRLEVTKLASAGQTVAATHLGISELVKRADALYDRAEFQEAIRLYRQVLEDYPTHDAVAHVAGRLAESLLMLDRSHDALEVLQKTAARSPQDAPRLLAQIVVYAASKRSADDVREKTTRLLLQRYPNTFEAEQALFIAGAVANTRKLRDEAGRHWQELLKHYPKTAFRTVVEREWKLASAPPPPPVPSPTPKKPTRDEIEARQLAQRRQLEREAWEWEVAYRKPGAPAAARARAAYELGQRQFALGQHAKAVSSYRVVWQQFPGSAQADLAAFTAAQAWHAANEPGKGDEQLHFVIRQFPQSPWRPVALYCLGNRRILYEGDLKRAWYYYDELLRAYPDHSLSDRTRKFWAAVKKLPPAKLREQVAAFVKQERQNRS